MYCFSNHSCPFSLSVEVAQISRMFLNNELPAMALCAAQLVADADRKRDVTVCVFEQYSPVEVLKRMDEWRAQNRELPCSSQVEACNIF